MAPPGPPPLPPKPWAPNRQNDILISTPILLFFATSICVVRLVVTWRKKHQFLLTDYLLIVGALFNIVGNVFSWMNVIAGEGKHIWDPTVNFREYARALWVSQLFNIWAMALVKGSICAYLFMLDFSKAFRIMVWISVVIHVITNVIYPSVILFGECNPIAKHWDPLLPGYCWSDKPRVVSGYLGAGANILTDLFYTSAPLVYLSSVQLNSRTKWGVRAVFLFALCGTTISALKFYEIRALHDTEDATYDVVNLSIFSGVEVDVGIFTACLPPLRKTFENLLRKFLPESVMGTSKKKSNQYALPAYGSRMSRDDKRKNVITGDDNSENAILPEELEMEAKGGIVKTTHVSVFDDDGRQYQEQQRKNDFV